MKHTHIATPGDGEGIGIERDVLNTPCIDLGTNIFSQEDYQEIRVRRTLGWMKRTQHTQQMSRVAFRWCVGSMARSRPTTPLRRPALSRCLRLTAPSPRMFSTANIDPAVYDDEMGDQFDPTESWGKPQAENRGTVTWWNQAKGIGMIKRVEDHKEFFVCKDEVKTDPFEEEPLIDLDDEKVHAHTHAHTHAYTHA